MTNKSEVRRYLAVIRRAVNFIEDLLDNDKIDLEEFALSPKAVAEVVEPTVSKQDRQKEARQKHIRELMAIGDWPEAIDKHLEATATQEDQINRANAVLDTMISRSTDGINFLDFGCGDGWMAKQMLLRKVCTSTGFDLITSDCWNQNDGVHFCSAFRELKKSHYDMIMLYDVLDHCEDPLLIMKQVRSLLAEDGVVYIRCHPWTAKHASHLYKDGLNKAYIHLFLTWDEIIDEGHTPLFTRMEKNPLEAYQWWFKSSEFNVVSSYYHKSEVHPFFQQKAFQELLACEQQLDDKTFPQFMESMELEFADYELML